MDDNAPRRTRAINSQVIQTSALALMVAAAGYLYWEMGNRTERLGEPRVNDEVSDYSESSLRGRGIVLRLTQRVQDHGVALVLNANGTARLAWTGGLSAVEGATPLTWSWRDGAMCIDGQGGQAKGCLRADRESGRVFDANRQLVGRIDKVTGVARDAVPPGSFVGSLLDTR